MATTIRILFVVLLVFSSSLWGQQKEKASKLGTPVFPKLRYVNLSEELKLEHDILSGLGATVDYARRDADAATVAGQAVLLAYVEQLAGTKATSMTSIRLLKEAARIAEEQQNQEALRAIELAAERIEGAATVVAGLREKLDLLAHTRGAGEFIAYVKIENKTGRTLDIYIDGNYMGYLYAGETSVYSSHNGTTNARVFDIMGNTVKEVFFLQPEQTFTWVITP